MNQRTMISALTFILWCAPFAYSQTTAKPNTSVKSTAAYAEILLRKTERTAELEELLLDYTEEFPKVKESRFEVGLLQKEMDKISAISATDAGKLTLALGKLLVRKIELQTDLWSLQIQYNDDHAEVKRARRKMEIYEKAVKEILP